MKNYSPANERVKISHICCNQSKIKKGKLKDQKIWQTFVLQKQYWI